MARASVLLALLIAVAACGGGDDAPPAGTPAAGTGSELDQAAPADGQPQDGAVADTQGGIPTAEQEQAETGLVRETFSYTGAGRDPFVSLVTSGAVKPEPQDLRIVAITFDPRYPQRSVATLRDRSDGARYTLQTGDQVGRVRVQAIREREVVLLIEEFGLERQMVLTLSRRTQEVNQ